MSSTVGPADIRSIESFSAIKLAGLVLPSSSTVLRNFARPSERRDPLYEQHFDRHTVAYDHWEEAGLLHFVCPRLLNLWSDVKSALRPRRKKYRRWELLSLPVNSAHGLKIGNLELAFAPGMQFSTQFAGLRVLTAVSRNNDIDWITDWAEFHQRMQGTEAILLFDNGSTSYSLDEVVERLSRVKGLKTALVVSAPYPYGPAHGKTAKLEVPGRFFQTAMLNLARLRFLALARSVLSLDIDEMLSSTGSSTAHEVAEASVIGLARMTGSWIYCRTHGGFRKQRDHDHRTDPEFGTTPKWCVDPSKLAGKMDWGVHRIFGDLDRLCHAKDQHLYHCNQTSTGWKTPREGTDRGLIFDPDLAALWRHNLD